MPYVLGIDLGRTSTVAALARRQDATWARPEVQRLHAQSTAVPSALRLARDGSFAVGESAGSPGGADNGRTARDFVGRVGDDVPLIVGGEACTAQALTAVLVAWVVEQVTAREQARPEAVVLSHPAGWGPYRRDLLHRALWEIGLADVTLLPQPITAAEAHAARGFTGATAAVYCLGGTGFEAGLVRRAPHGGFEVFGVPATLEPLGGADFDEALAGHVRDVLGRQAAPRDPGDGPAAAELLARCARARHDLTVATDTDVALRLPHGPIRVPVSRAEFEELVRPAVRTTVELTAQALRSAGLAPADLDAILLTGGCARTPLVAEVLAARFARPVEVEADPQATSAVGAALAAGQVVAPRPTRTQPRPGADREARPDRAEPGRRADRASHRYANDRPEPPPRPPVRVAPLELPRASRLAALRGRGRGRR
ncbi:Hsp70 family protein [Micromonospora olivasterospora]|uniref:Hsp70 protein n=1 Tax=Micromonospora olivasterospora TaxID=1880 RepID=A0A562IH85_MICOL|nr:Hsp70 family protein [Micromonospora olivasterospora]TWH70401.1 Hsp70 protein [Micromonospora olivasterospora]